MESLFKKPAAELAHLVRSKDLSPVDLIEATLRRIEAVNPSINSLVALRADDALEEAGALAENINRRSSDQPAGCRGLYISFQSFRPPGRDRSSGVVSQWIAGRPANYRTEISR